jgi:hypothetical protein
MQITPGAADRSNVTTLALLGMLSAGVAWALIMFTAGQGSYTRMLKVGGEIEVSTLTVLPGLIFGLIIGILWHRRGRASLGVVFGYALAAGVAYFLAFHVAFNVFDRASGLFRGEAALVVSGIAAGLVGSGLLGVATAYLLRAPYQSALGLPVLIGGAAGALLPLINMVSEWDGGFLFFLILWQGAYAASLAPLLHPGPVTVG